MCFLSVGDSVVFKWLLLSEVLVCSERMVIVRSSSGAVHEAKAQCLEALKLATKLQTLSQWVHTTYLWTWEAECVWQVRSKRVFSDIEGQQHKPTNAFFFKPQVGLNVLLGCQTNCLCICNHMLFCFIAVLSCWCWKQNWSWWRVQMKLVVWIWSKLETYLIFAQVKM